MMYTYNARVVKVVDGDTVDLDIDLGFGVVLRKQRGRLWGINAPESRTRDKAEKKRGLAAKNRLRDILSLNNNELCFISKEKGKYGRYLVQLFVKELDTINDEIKTKLEVISFQSDKIIYDVNSALVLEGHAVRYFGGKR